MNAKEKEKVFDQYCVGATFVCPQCNTLHSVNPNIENLGEEYDNEEPQVYCMYGCGYLFLPEKNILTNKNKTK